MHSIRSSYPFSMYQKFSLPALAVLLAIAWPAHAQTMAHVLAQAWSRHPLAASGTLNRSAAQARADVADSLTPGPAALSLSALDDQPGANRGRQEWELELETPLWLPGQRGAARAEASATQKELDAQQRALRLQLAGEVREAWWAVAEARSKHTLAQTRLAATQALASDVARRVRVGELARVDHNLAQVEQLAAQAELDDAYSALQQVQQSFQALTGAEAPAELPAETLTHVAWDVDTHPQVMAAAASKDLAQAKLTLAQTSQRGAPTLAMRLVRERADFSDTYADAVGLKLTIPFSLGANVSLELNSSQAQLLQAEAEHAQVVHRMALATQTSQRRLKVSQLQLALATQRLTLTQDNLALLEKSFALGESDLPALLRARAAHFDAQALLQHQQINAHAAVSHINQSLGVLP